MQTLTREQVREVEQRVIEELGIPAIVLMENAGREVAMAVLDALEGDLHLVAQDSRVGVLCGGGNNGGDGYVAARHLANHGVQVTAFAVVDPATLKPDAAVHHRIAANMGLVVPMFTEEQLLTEQDRLGESHVIVDAMLGTGFTGEVRPHIAAMIDTANHIKAQGALIVAVDVPSGLDCDTGRAADSVIHADATVTFIAPKPGMVQPEAEVIVGRLTIGDIGATRI